jgi:hypothetical protein
MKEARDNFTKMEKSRRNNDVFAGESTELENLTEDGESSPYAQFELNVPEHLPSSSLCPKHSRHKSGGRGTCVYHGRRRSFSSRRDQIQKSPGDGNTGADPVSDEGFRMQRSPIIREKGKAIVPIQGG